MRTLFAVFILSICSVVNAQDFIQQQIYSPPIVQSNVVYPVSPVQQPIVVYQWVPYVDHQTMIVENYCLLRRTQTVVARPVVRWVYQPVLIYR